MNELGDRIAELKIFTKIDFKAEYDLVLMKPGDK
jgi:hypothetical protein